MKVKFFSGLRLDELEYRINAWLESFEGEIQSIQHTTTPHDMTPFFTAMVVYKEKSYGEF